MIFQPEFFDIFGLGVFGFVAVISLWSLKTKNPIPRWTLILLLIIDAFGLIIDGGIVYTTYLR